MADLVRRRFVIATVSVLVCLAVALPASAIIYEGQPDLALTSSLVAAGGGPKHFSSKRVFMELAGDRAGAEAEKLTQQFGASAVAETFALFDYAVDDTLAIAAAKHIALPPPSPDPGDARALATALYGAGTSGSGRWDVGFMLEHLISHPIHHVIMHDMDDKFGPPNNARFHIVLAQLMDDLSREYAPPVVPAASATP